MLNIRLNSTFCPLSFKMLRFWPPIKKNDKSDPPCLGKYALLTPNIREICFLTPYLYKKLRLWPLFRDTWRVLSNFGTKGAKIANFLIGGQNRNILKLRGQKVQFSLNINMILMIQLYPQILKVAWVKRYFVEYVYLCISMY